MTKYLTQLILFILITSKALPGFTEDSPFDVLNDLDRYKSEEAATFDVSEGEENIVESTTIPNTEPITNKPQNTGQQYEGKFTASAKLIALNKITAKSQLFDIKIGKFVYFGNIKIHLIKCWTNNNPYLKEDKMLLEVIESRLDEDPHKIFQGWIISNNPAISALEHPSYELIAMECHD